MATQSQSQSPKSPLVWLVTGSTSGIGLALVNHIISRGDKVIASGRKIEARLGHLKSQSSSVALLELDITSPAPVITQKITQAWSIFGHIDVLVNNAGMSAMKPAEEASDEYISNMFSVNLFGPMQITKAILPFFRAQNSGTLAFTSSSTSWTSLPFMSHYSASKAALSQYVECLRKEVSPLGIQCIALESGGMPTHLGQPRDDASVESFGTETPGIAAYQPGLASLGGMFMSDPMAYMPGDLGKVSKLIVDIIKREGLAEGKDLPARVLFGSDAYESVTQKLNECLTLFGEWKDAAYSTDRDGYDHVTKEDYLKAVSIL
ncbi:hypothetical protein V8F20_009176 [Naviculisporaceae sp. PSN 640]